MNKLYAILLISVCPFIYSSDVSTPRNTLITAITRNDYGTVAKTLETYQLSQDEKQELLEMAEMIIAATIKWRNNHHWHPEFGKDYFKSVGYSFATYLAGVLTFLTAASDARAIKAQFDRYKLFGHNKLTPLHYSVGASSGLAIITGFLFYKSIQNAIGAWMKPTQRLENALRIKDALLRASTI